jgi:hypothetical protein
MPKRLHPYGLAYVIQMAFLKLQQEAIIPIALLPAIASGVFFLLSLFYHLKSPLVDSAQKTDTDLSNSASFMHGDDLCMWRFIVKLFKNRFLLIKQCLSQ